MTADCADLDIPAVQREPQQCLANIQYFQARNVTWIVMRLQRPCLYLHEWIYLVLSRWRQCWLGSGARSHIFGGRFFGARGEHPKAEHWCKAAIFVKAAGQIGEVKLADGGKNKNNVTHANTNFLLAFSAQDVVVNRCEQIPCSQDICCFAMRVACVARLLIGTTLKSYKDNAMRGEFRHSHPALA